MRYMVVENFKAGRASEIYRRFRERGRMAPDDVKGVASWGDVEFKRCYQGMETDDESRLTEWTKHWDDLTEFENIPRRTSAEAPGIKAAALRLFRRPPPP